MGKVSSPRVLWGRHSSGGCGGAAGMAWHGRAATRSRERGETVWVRVGLSCAGPQTSRSLTGFSLFILERKRIVDGFRALVELTLWNIFWSSSQDFFWKNVVENRERKSRFEGDLFTPCLVHPQYPKSCYSTYHIECLRPMHGAFNVDEKKN